MKILDRTKVRHQTGTLPLYIKIDVRAMASESLSLALKSHDSAKILDNDLFVPFSDFICLEASNGPGWHCLVRLNMTRHDTDTARKWARHGLRRGTTQA